MKMLWAPEATFVPDFDGQGDGAFVTYWRSSLDGGNQRIMWGVTPDFKLASWEFGGILVDEGGNTIDTTMIQEGGRTCRVTKDNAGNKGLYMEFTDAEQWWLPETERILSQTQSCCLT